MGLIIRLLLTISVKHCFVCGAFHIQLQCISVLSNVVLQISCWIWFFFCCNLAFLFWPGLHSSLMSFLLCIMFLFFCIIAFKCVPCSAGKLSLLLCCRCLMPGNPPLPLTLSQSTSSSLPSATKLSVSFFWQIHATSSKRSDRCSCVVGIVGLGIIDDGFPKWIPVRETITN